MCYNYFGDIMEKKKMMTIGIVVIVIVLFAVIASFTGNDKKINFKISGNVADLPYENENPVVAMKIDGYGVVAVELYPDVAPNTVNNFVNLVKDGFYDKNNFHRLMSGFVLQGGDPTGTGSGGPGYAIRGEFTRNGFKNSLKHTEGVISMARSTAYNSAGSQFFIMLGSSNTLDGLYASFGKVIDGMDVLKMIEKNEAVIDAQSGKLAKNITITKMIVDLNNNEIGETVKVEFDD